LGRNYNRREITFPKLILCEGPADEAFLRALISNRKLGNVSIRNTGDADPDGRGSISKFRELLLAASTWRQFHQVTDILIVSDSDDDPTANFADICKQIAASENQSVTPHVKFVAPTEFLKPATGAPAIRLLTIPWIDEPGNVERLCSLSALEIAVHAKHVDTFGESTRAYHWKSANAVGKFKMRAILAASNESDPAIGIGKLWEGPNKDAFVPLGHKSFDRIAEVLRTFLA
jgi:hypothetical protein